MPQFVGAVFGFNRLLATLINSSGYPTGTAATLAPGEGSGAFVSNYLQSAELAAANPETVEIRNGDNVRVAQVLSGDGLLQTFTLVNTVVDSLFIQLVSGAVTDDENTAQPSLSYNPYRTALPIIGLGLIQRKYAPGTQAIGSAAQTFTTQWLPLTNVRPQPGALPQNNFAVQNYQVSPFPSARNIAGQTFASTNLAITDGATDSYLTEYRSAAPHLYAWRVEGTSANTFRLPYLPVTSTVTATNTTNQVWRNGVVEAATSVSTTTGDVTVAAGAENDWITVIYETNYVRSPAP